MPGSKVTKRCWEQDGLDLEGMQAAARGVERTEGGDETDMIETDTD